MGDGLETEAVQRVHQGGAIEVGVAQLAHDGRVRRVAHGHVGGGVAQRVRVEREEARHEAGDDVERQPRGRHGNVGKRVLRGHAHVGGHIGARGAHGRRQRRRRRAQQVGREPRGGAGQRRGRHVWRAGLGPASPRPRTARARRRRTRAMRAVRAAARGGAARRHADQWARKVNEEESRSINPLRRAKRSSTESWACTARARMCGA
ncbi:amino acid adenylation domain protein [Gracilaria domingensis]|nr:amino acid adenylation domain protein [Gracilaria domingensis]